MAAPASASAAAAATDAKAAPVMKAGHSLAANFDSAVNGGGGTAVIAMDFQNGILSRVVGKNLPALLTTASAVLDASRAAHLPVMYVNVAQRAGYASVAPHNKMFGGILGSGLLLEGTEDVAIHASVAPKAGEPLITKRRVGALFQTDLSVLLSAAKVRHLILFGVSTSGVVLSTLRAAADADFAVTIVADACADADPEVHTVLTQKVFPRQALVVTSAELLAHLSTIKPKL